MKTLIEKIIVVVGVSANPDKFGQKIFRSLLRDGYNVFGVNPRGGRILDRDVYKSLSEISVVPDLVITAVKPEVTEKIVEECVKLGIKEIWMQPGSESEQGGRNSERFRHNRYTQFVHHA